MKSKEVSKIYANDKASMFTCLGTSQCFTPFYFQKQHTQILWRIHFLIQWPWISDINLNYLGGPNVITRFLNVEKWSRTGNKSETRTLHWAWLTFKIEDRGHEPRNVRFLKARKVKETNVPLHSSERRLGINK